MSEASDTRETIWERRITALFVSLLTLIGGWTAIGVHNQAGLVGRIEERLNSLSTHFARMEASMSNQYTKQDAARDFAIRDRQIADLQERTRSLERDGND